MVYVFKYTNGVLKDQNGNTVYQASGGELVVGDRTTATGAGFVIDPKPTAVDGTKIMTRMGFTSVDADPLVNALENIGLGDTFWKAPDLTVAASTQALTSGSWYKVLDGSIVFGGVTYYAGQRFKAGSSANFTGTGTARFDVPDEHFVPDEDNFRAKAFSIVHTSRDEMAWDDVNFGPTTVSPIADR